MYCEANEMNSRCAFSNSLACVDVRACVCMYVHIYKKMEFDV